MMRVLLLLSLLTVACAGQTLRVSRAFDQPVAGAEAMRLLVEGYPLLFHVEQRAVFTEKDVASARVVPGRTGVLELKLTPDGAKKLREATKAAAGDLRLAVLVDEQLQCAPLVRGPLGDTMWISGLGELGKEELADLAKALARAK